MELTVIDIAVGVALGGLMVLSMAYSIRAAMKVESAAELSWLEIAGFLFPLFVIGATLWPLVAK